MKVPKAIFLSSLASLLFGYSSGCDIYRTFDYDPHGLVSDNLDPFNVAADGTTVCTTTCKGGLVSSLYLKYGGFADEFNFDGYDYDHVGCDMSVTIKSSKEESHLGWRLVVGGSYSDLEITCSCTAPGTGGGSIDDNPPKCFSESATVETRDRGTVAMKDLEVGDYVFVGEDARPKYERVYSFGHFHQDLVDNFLKIYTDASPKPLPLEVTGNHMVFAKQSNGKYEAVRADEVKIGDILKFALPGSKASEAKVTKIGEVSKKGMYMPLTPSGSLVVNGLLASSYVSIREEAPSVVDSLWLFGMTEHNLLHWWLAPHRLMCLGINSKLCGNKKAGGNRNEEGIVNWLVFGKGLAEWANGLVSLIRVILLGVAILMLGVIVLLENVFGPALVPPVFAIVGADLLWKNRQDIKFKFPAKKHV